MLLTKIFHTECFLAVVSSAFSVQTVDKKTGIAQAGSGTKSILLSVVSERQHSGKAELLCGSLCSYLNGCSSVEYSQMLSAAALAHGLELPTLSAGYGYALAAVQRIWFISDTSHNCEKISLLSSASFFDRCCHLLFAIQSRSYFDALVVGRSLYRGLISLKVSTVLLLELITESKGQVLLRFIANV